jgi:hypothetical protein
MISATDLVQSIVSWAALLSSLAAIIGVLAIRNQLRQSERTLLGSTSQFCYTSMTQLLQILIDKPHLRPYLYEGKSVPSDDQPDLRQQVLAIAAHYADFFDAVLLQGTLGNIAVHEYIEVWQGFISNMLQSSQVIRDYVLDHESWYTERLRCMASLAAEPSQ